MARAPKKIWHEEERRAILQEAGRIKLDQSDIADTLLVRTAKKVLPPDLQRTIPPIDKLPSYDWFRAGLVAAVEEAGLAKQAEFHAEEEVPLPEVPPDLHLLAGLVAALRETEDRSNADRRAISEVSIRLGRHESRIETLIDRIEGMVGGLESVLKGGFMAMIYPSGQVPPVPIVQPQSSALPAAAPETTQTRTRKPKVIVLDPGEGHEKDGLRKGAEGYLSALDFGKTSFNNFPSYQQYDHIICTKRTSADWIKNARTMIPNPDRILVIPGNVRDRIVPRLKELPEIEVKD